jgi:hypothetical protein
MRFEVEPGAAQISEAEAAPSRSADLTEDA